MMANRSCSASGGATTTAPSAWTNSSLAGIFDKKYTKTITSYWPYNTLSSAIQATKGRKFPVWAAAVIGVLLYGLLIAAIHAGLWYQRRRRRRRQPAPVEEKKEVVSTADDTKLIHQGGPTSPGPGPVSESTEPVSETTVPETVQGSMVSSATPVTVESGGGTVYEMHGMSTASYQALSRITLNTHIDFLQDSSAVELPTQFNVAFSSLNPPPQPSPMQTYPSPISPETPAGPDSENSYSPTNHRRPSSLSIIPPLLANNVVIGRMSLSNEYLNSMNLQRGYYGSGVSETSVSSAGREGFRRIPGSDTIHEKE